VNPHEDALLSVHELAKAYGSVQAVKDVSFFVRRGSVFTLLGPNGAGKTTTLEILEGIRPADAGTIELFGERTQHVSSDLKQRMGVLLQDSNFEPYLKVREVVALFASFFRRSLPVDEILEKVSLTEKAGALVRTLSGGQKQRLAVGVALINDPELVFLDEPTTGLDPQARRNLWRIFQTLQYAGKTLILTTHYMEEAEVLSNHVCIMDHGAIIAEGSPAELAEALGQATIIEFRAEELPAEAGEDLARRFPDLKRRRRSIILNTRDFTGGMEELLRWSREHAFLLHNLNVRQPNLEDVFLSLTGRRLRE